MRALVVLQEITQDHAARCKFILCCFVAAAAGCAWIRSAVGPCPAPIWPREVMDSVVLACRDLAKKLQKQSQQKQQKDTSGRKMDRIKAA